MDNKDKIGGRAYNNGLRLRNNKYSVKVYYDQNDNLKIETQKVITSKYMEYIKKIPVIRGIAALLVAVFSFLKEVFKNPLKYWFIFLIILADIIYVSLPASTGAVYQEIFLVIYFAIPIALIFIFRNSVSEVFKFHGAEHKAVNYYEDNYTRDMASYSRIHRRCGSNIIFFYIIFTIIASFFNIGVNVFIQNLFILGLSYEVMKITPEKLLIFPAMFQKIVTKEPEQRQLEAAKLALQALLYESETQEKLRK